MSPLQLYENEITALRLEIEFRDNQIHILENTLNEGAPNNEDFNPEIEALKKNLQDEINKYE